MSLHLNMRISRARGTDWSRSIPARLLLLTLLAAMAVAGCEDDATSPEPKNPTASAPTSVISSPARGAFLQEGTAEDLLISIEGEACDPTNKITSVVLKGSSLTLSESGECASFATELNSNWGLNTLYGLITNDAGSEVALVQSYIRSGEFFAAPREKRSSAAVNVVGIPQAFRARFGQDAIDDRARNDNDDLVSVINLALAAQQQALQSYINGEIPNPIYSNVVTRTWECLLQTRTQRDGVLFRKNGTLQLNGLQISEFTTGADEFVVGISTGRIAFPFEVFGYQDNGCLGELITSATGTTGISGSNIHVTISAETVNGEIQFNVTDVDITLGSAFVDIELGGLLGWFDNLISAALTTVGNAAAFALESALADWVASEWISQFGAILGMNVFDMGVLSGPLLNVTVNVETETDVLEVGNGFIDYGVTANAYPSQYAKTPEQLAAGTVIGSSTLPAFADMTGSFGLGLKHDFVNQVFWAFWAGGGFDFDEASDAALDQLNAAIPTDGITVTSMVMSLPPVLMPGDTEAELKLGVGEIKLLANIEQTAPSLFAGQPAITVEVPLTVYATVVFSAEIGLDQESRKLRVDVAEEAEVHVQIEGALRDAQMVELESMFANAISKLVELLIVNAGASIGLPSLSLGQLGVPGIPSGLTWVLDDGVLDQVSGYVRILGSVGIR